jgi:hypothetical protein
MLCIIILNNQNWVLGVRIPKSNYYCQGRPQGGRRKVGASAPPWLFHGSIIITIM